MWLKYQEELEDFIFLATDIENIQRGNSVFEETGTWKTEDISDCIVLDFLQ